MRLAAVACVLTLSGCVDAELAVVPLPAAIVNGTGSLADDAVVALTVGGQHFCSGTLVRDNIVVTAAHCLPPNLDVAATSIEVFFGRSMFEGGELVGVVDAFAHPDWTLDSIANDVGVIALAWPVAVEPIPLRTAPMTDLVDHQLRLIGFGITSAGGGGSGIRRQGTGAIDAIEGASILLAPEPAVTCNGDSGGPALYDDGTGEQLAGIHSRSDCVSVYIDERVDVHVDDFIMPFIARNGGVGCSGDGVCNAECARDSDCAPVCEGDGACNAECDNDPDCRPSCEADGACEVECDSDPDCGPSCEADGECAAVCGNDSPDPDCEADAIGDGGGCAVSRTGGAPASLLVLLCCAFVRRRRQPACVILAETQAS